MHKNILKLRNIISICEIMFAYFEYFQLDTERIVRCFHANG